MIPHPVIDVTSRPQTLEELSAPLEARRDMARRAGELWAVMVTSAPSQFFGTDTVNVSVIVLNSTDDQRVKEFEDIVRVQRVPAEVVVFEVIGSENDVALQAHRMGLSHGPNAVEVSVRLVDRIARAAAAEEQRTDNLRNAPDEEDGE